MHVIVCIKSVVIRASGSRLTPDGRLIRTPDALELNPYDRPAIELALRLREEHGGQVTALCMGPDSSADALYEAMAMGVDRCVLACDQALAGSDTLATSTALAAAINKLSPFDLLLFGVRTADSDTGQVGPQTAAALDLPLVTGATSVTAAERGFRIQRRVDGFREEYEASPPVALTVHPTAMTARDAPLAGIEDAYSRGAIERLSCADLGLDPAATGESGSPTLVLSIRPVTRERKCELIQGTVDEQAEALITRLTDKGLLG